MNMFWLQPIAVLGVFAARMLELRHKFPAQTGRVEAAGTLRGLTAAGSVTVIAALAEYFIVKPPPSVLLAASGLLMAALAFALRAWSRAALGRMWSIHVEIRDQHELVQHGPYRFVRHPIYVAAIIEIAAVPMTLGSWRTGILGVIVYIAALAARVKAEEAAMDRQLGASWKTYQQKTGAFFPKW